MKKNSHSHHHDLGEKNISIAFWLNLGFAVLEFFGGIMTNSLAITSDALHDLGDSLSLGLSWLFVKVSKRKRTESFSYGFKRFSLLAALINGVILLVGSMIILSNAIPRIFTPEPTDTKGMLFLAFLGVIVNGFAVFRLKGGKTMNEQMVMWHLLEDVFGWVVIIIGSIVMLIQENYILDPILSVLITAYVMWNVFKNLKKTVNIFLQGIPDNINKQDIVNKLLETKSIEGIHDVHIWSLDGENHVLTMHVAIAKETLPQEESIIKENARGIIESFGIQHSTIELEHAGENCDLKDC